VGNRGDPWGTAPRGPGAEKPARFSLECSSRFLEPVSSAQPGSEGKDGTTQILAEHSSPPRLGRAKRPKLAGQHHGAFPPGHVGTDGLLLAAHPLLAQILGGSCPLRMSPISGPAPLSGWAGHTRLTKIFPGSPPLYSIALELLIRPPAASRLSRSGHPRLLLRRVLSGQEIMGRKHLTDSAPTSPGRNRMPKPSHIFVRTDRATVL